MSLSRSDVLNAAMHILDTYGLADLTMRRLASTLGVQPGALYWHFANKQSLLAALADDILADLPRLDQTLWDAAISRWAQRLHYLLRQHRSGAELVSGVLALRTWEESPARPVYDLLIDKGVDCETAQAAAAGIMHLVLGHSSDEEQAAQLAELGIRGDGVASNSAQLLDTAVELMLRGLERHLDA